MLHVLATGFLSPCSACERHQVMIALRVTRILTRDICVHVIELDRGQNYHFNVEPC